MKNTIPTVVRAADLAAYSPANHTGTSNVRVIGPRPSARRRSKCWSARS